MGEFLSATEAARFLGVKPSTLYAYVSRGLVRSRPHGEGRERQYLRADVARLKAARRVRAPGSGISGALHWGEPVLESSITRITPQGPAYRGHLAVDLAGAGIGFESVAELLWSGGLPASAPRWSWEGLGVAAGRLARFADGGSPPLTFLSLLLPALGARDPGRFDTSRAAVLGRARPLLLRMAAAPTASFARYRTPSGLAAGTTVAAMIALAACGSGDSDLVQAIDRALVLLADHELNVSAFAARVAASAGADVYASLSAALAALSGPKHGGHIERVEALVGEVGVPERARRVVHDRARRGEHLPGFGHPLYPQGDPRATPLLEAARAIGSRQPAVRTILALIDAMAEEGRPPPTIDTGLVSLSAALGLPQGFAVALFAIGRTAGWIAHVLEQYEADFLIRPRALFRER